MSWSETMCSRFVALLVSGMVIIGSWSAFAIDLTAPPSTLSRSVSGQFLVSTKALRPLAPKLAIYLTNSQFVCLEPIFLMVSCERIRSALNRELDETGKWTGTVYVSLYPARTTNDTVYIRPAKPRSWQYHLELPQLIDRKRFVTAVAQTLLLEISNREAENRSAEIPIWMAEGFARHLLSTSEAQLVLTSPRRVVNGVSVDALFEDARREHPLAQAHEHLLSQPALSFHELSWPDSANWDQAGSERFGACAQLLVHELLELPNGRNGMRSMLARLPNYLNWQFAFLQGFHEHFRRPLDIEKWWALRLACFSSRDLAQTWSTAEGYRRLAQVLQAQVDIHHGTNVANAAQTSLQVILTDWEPVDQAEMLRHKVAQLDALCIRVSPDVAMLAQEYRAVLSAVLPPLEKSKPTALSDRKVEETVRALNNLDARRSAIMELDARVAEQRVAAAHPNTQVTDQQP